MFVEPPRAPPQRAGARARARAHAYPHVMEVPQGSKLPNMMDLGPKSNHQQHMRACMHACMIVGAHCTNACVRRADICTPGAPEALRAGRSSSSSSTSFSPSRSTGPGTYSVICARRQRQRGNS